MMLRGRSLVLTGNALVWRVIAVCAVSATVSLWMAAIVGLANPLQLPFAERAGSNELGLRTIIPQGAEDTHLGVTARIVQAGFSSSETALLLEIQGLAPEQSIAKLRNHVTADVQGIRGGVATLRVDPAEPSVDGHPRLALALGPVIDVNSPLILSLTYVDGESPTTWRLSFIPGAAANDPIDINLTLNQTLDYGRVSLAVKGVHLSSSQVSVFYDILTEPWTSAFPVDELARIVYEDGSTVSGAHTSQFVERLPDGSLKPRATDPLANAPYTLNLPLVRPATVPFVLRFGDLTVGVPGSSDYVIPINGTSLANLGQDTFDLTRESDHDGNIVIRAVRRQGGTALGSFLADSVDKAILYDDLGNTYAFLNGERGFRKTPATKPVADRTVLVFRGPLNPQARELRLSVPDHDEVVSPTGPVEIAIQAETTDKTAPP